MRAAAWDRVWELSGKGGGWGTETQGLWVWGGLGGVVPALPASSPQPCAEPLCPQMHVVHYDAERYTNASEAQHHAGGLAVLGVLLEVCRPQNTPCPPPNPPALTHTPPHPLAPPRWVLTPTPPTTTS